METMILAGTIIAAVIAAIASGVAVRAADIAIAQSRKLATLRGTVFELDGALQQLANQHRKLEGRFYGTLGAQRAREAEEELPQAAPPKLPDGYCENWYKAQKTGPRSDAASCGCDFCVAMREQRHNVRAALVPKSQAARINQLKTP